MKRCILSLVLLVSAQHVYAQDYLDVAKVSYSSTRINYREQHTSSQVNAFDATLFSPFRISASSHVLVGADLNLRSLALSNNENITTFYNTLFRLGVSKVFSPDWNGYIVALPKFASDFDQNLGSSLMVGGFAMLKRVRNESLTWKYGIYGSQEAFGFFGTPIIGIFYRSPGTRLTVDATLPLLGDVNYTLNTKKSTSIGLDFLAIRRSFFMGQDNEDQRYIENNEIHFAPYVQYATLDSKLLLRLKAGYASTDYGLYSVHDEKMIGISAFNIGDNRTRLNQSIQGGLLLKLEATLRIGTRK